MKAMLYAFGAIAVIAIGAHLGLDSAGFTSGEVQASHASVRLGE